MIDAYAIGVDFKLSNDFNQKLQQTVQTLEKISRLLRDVRDGLGKAHAATKAAKGATGELEGAVKNTRRATEELARHVGVVDRAAVRAATAFGQVNAQAARVNRTVGGGAAQVGVMTRAVNGLEAAFKRVAGTVAGMNGGVAALSAYGAAHAAERAMEPAFENRHIQQQLRAAGMTPQQIQTYSEVANQVSRSRPDASANQNLEMLAQMRSVLGDDTKVAAIAPFMADFATNVRLAQSRPGDKKVNLGNLFQDAMRVVEMRGKLYGPDGKLDLEGIKAELAYQWQVTAQSHGNVNSHTLVNTVRQMGTTNAAAMSARAFYGEGFENYNTLGSHQAGTAMMTLLNQLRGGEMPQNVLRRLIKAGWVDPKKLKMVGGKVEWNPEALVGHDRIGSNPFAWLHDRITEDAARLGVAPERIVQMNFGRNTSRREAGEVLKNYRQMLAAADRVDSALGPNPGSTLTSAAAETRRADPATVMNNFSAAWSNMLKGLGDPLVDTVLGHINGMSEAMGKAADWVKQNPETAKQLTEFLAGGAAIGVGLAGLTAGIGLLSGALTVFGLGAVGMVALENLTGEKGLAALSAGLVKLSEGFKALPEWLVTAALGATVGGRVAGVPGALAGGLAGAVAPSLGNLLRSDNPDWGLGPGAREARRKQLEEADARRRGDKPSASALSPGAAATLNGLTPGGAGAGQQIDPKALSDMLDALNPRRSGGRAPGLESLRIAPENMALPSPGRQSSFVPRGGSQQVAVQSVLYLDGERVFQSWNRAAARRASLPGASGSAFDGRRTPASAGTRYAT